MKNNDNCVIEELKDFAARSRRVENFKRKEFMHTLLAFFQIQILSWMVVAPVAGCFIPYDRLMIVIVSGTGLAAFLFGKRNKNAQDAPEKITVAQNSRVTVPTLNHDAEPRGSFETPVATRSYQTFQVGRSLSLWRDGATGRTCYRNASGKNHLLDRKYAVKKRTLEVLMSVLTGTLITMISGCEALDNAFGPYRSMKTQSGETVTVLRDWDGLYYLENGAKVYVNEGGGTRTPDRPTNWNP